MSEKEMYRVEKELIEIAKTKDYVHMKGYIANIYQYNHVSEKMVYRKLLKASLKILSAEDLQPLLDDFLIYNIDNCKDFSYMDLITELVKILKNKTTN